MKKSNLNANELLVLEAIVHGHDNAGGDFTYFDEVMEVLQDCNVELTQNQVKGYLSQLIQKEYIVPIDPDWEQINLTKKCETIPAGGSWLWADFLDDHNISLY